MIAISGAWETVKFTSFFHSPHSTVVHCLSAYLSIQRHFSIGKRRKRWREKEWENWCAQWKYSKENLKKSPRFFIRANEREKVGSACNWKCLIVFVIHEERKSNDRKKSRGTTAIKNSNKKISLDCFSTQKKMLLIKLSEMCKKEVFFSKIFLCVFFSLLFPPAPSNFHVTYFNIVSSSLMRAMDSTMFPYVNRDTDGFCCLMWAPVFFFIIIILRVWRRVDWNFRCTLTTFRCMVLRRRNYYRTYKR